jgi:hypothetical protein
VHGVVSAQTVIDDKETVMRTALPRKGFEPFKWAAPSLSCDSPKELFELDPTHAHGVVCAQTVMNDNGHTERPPLELEVSRNGHIPICDSPKGLFELDPTHVRAAFFAQTI